MKQKVSGLALLTTAIVTLSFIFLLGCVASKKDKFVADMSARGAKTLNGPEIQKAFGGKTILGEHPKYRYARYYAIDGTAKGRAWGSWGEESANGVWRINDEGLICAKFQGDWAKSGERCSQVYHIKGNQYAHIIITGTRSKTNQEGIYQYEVVPGDQSGMK